MRATMLHVLPRRRARLVSSLASLASMSLVFVASVASAQTADGSTTASTQTAEGSTPAPGAAAPATGTAAPAAPATTTTTTTETKKDESAPAAPPAGEEEKAGESKEEEKEKEASHAIYISGDFGYTRPDVAGFSDSDLGFDKTAANGILFGLGVGYRQRELRVGARFRSQNTTEFNLWSIMAEVGYGMKLRPVSPTFLFHAGYMFDTDIERAVINSSLPPGNILTPDVDLKGLVVGAEVVASYWLTQFLRVGPFIGFDATFLHRSQVSNPQSIYAPVDATANNPLFTGSGSGVGYILNLGIRGTADFGF